MLSADSPRWAELEHAYGDATQLPTHLYELFDKQNYDDDPNHVLFGCLCHQGSVYTATYAAVPHVVNALATQSIQSQIWLFMFLGQVAISKDAEEIPNDLRSDFLEALQQVKPLVISAAKQRDIPAIDYSHLLSAVPALHGLDTTHYIVDWLLTAHEVCGLCEQCGEEFSVDAETLPFKARHVRQHPTLAPVRGAAFPENVGIQGTPHGVAMEVSPSTIPAAMWDGVIRDDNAMAWLTRLATSAGHSLIVEKVLALFGCLACPNCKKQVFLWEAARHERQT